MLGCLNFPCQCLSQMWTLKGAGPCHFSCSEPACCKTSQTATPQCQAYGQGTSQKELSNCKHAPCEHLPKRWKPGPEKITRGNFM